MKSRRLLLPLILGLGLALAVLAGLGGNLPRARAATYTVINTDASGPGSLRQAILDANSSVGHDTIDFGVSGTIVLTDALPAISDDLTVTGPGSDQLDISGANTYRVFTVNSGQAVTITGLTVRDGHIAGVGGGIWSAGTLYLEDVRIVDSTASGLWPSGNGGGVYISQGSVTLSGTLVSSNSASQSGGGVYVYGGSATLGGTHVLSNSADHYGGGVYVYGGSATLNGTHVISNSADDDGGGMYVYQGSATLSGTHVLSNSADYGGGVYISEGSATLSGTRVVSNSSVYGSGGGVYVEQGSVTLSGTQVISNSADDDGGGVYVEQGSVTLTGTQVVNNSASSGGGVYVSQGSATLNVSGGEVGSNSAGGGGGGVYVDLGGATLSGTQVVSNSADVGGGVYVGYGCATLNGAQVASNSADEGGGGVYVYQGSATLSGTRVIRNSSVYSGGGVCVDEGSATLTGTQVVSNSSGDDGGGVYVWDGSATLINARVLNNSADHHGGGVYVQFGSATLNGTRVVSNSADYRGGGVYVYWGSATLNVDGGEIGGNSAEQYGGGVYVLYGNATLTETQVIRNSSGDDGGGVCVWDGSATLINARVLNNSADVSGGGLYQKDGRIIAMNGCIVNNSDTSVVRNSGDTLVATGNWWGAADGPSGVGPGNGDSVSAGVDYSGFLTAPPPGCPVLAPDLVIVKAVIPTEAAPGEAITYTLSFSNAGTMAASGVVITDAVPISVTDTSAISRGDVTITPRGGTRYVWDVANLAPGAGGTITVTGVLSDPLADGSFANSATIASDDVDANLADNVDTAWLTVSATPNQPPVADAGSDQSVDTGAPVTLDGSGSNDPDGDLPLTYYWTQTGGPSVSFNPALSITTFTAPNPTVLTFTLAVTDGLGLPDPTPDEVAVTVSSDEVLLPVNSLNDPGDGPCDASECTLREAVAVAESGDTITFDPALAGSTIVLGCDITLDKDLVIDGSGLSPHVQVSGGGSVRVFGIPEGLTIAIYHLDIRDGHAPSGGGIDILASTLTVSNTTFSGNSADDGGAIDVNDGTLFVTDCSFVGNSAWVYGGAIDNNMGTTTIVGSTFSGNSSNQYGGGVFNDHGDVTVTNSTWYSNSATLEGGGLLNYEGTMEVRNCTLSGNSAPSGGGIINGTNGTLHLWNTVVADSLSGGDCLNDGTIATNINNLIEDGTCSPAVTGAPRLGPLADNGGSTHTMALQAGSPALDAGDDATCEAMDQRGVSRPQGPHCDIGAYESVHYILTVTLDGTGSGSVSSDPAGIDCGGDCSHSYSYGTVVTLTATADTGSTFTGWSGACSGSGDCVVTIDAARSVTANFALNQYALTVSRAGTGSGSVSSDPAGIDCGGDCSHSYAYGTAVTLTASADTGSTFTGWGGACSGSGDCTVTITGATSITATFDCEYRIYLPLVLR